MITKKKITFSFHRDSKLCWCTTILPYTYIPIPKFLKTILYRQYVEYHRPCKWLIISKLIRIKRGLVRGFIPRFFAELMLLRKWFCSVKSRSAMYTDGTRHGLFDDGENFYQFDWKRKKRFLFTYFNGLRYILTFLNIIDIPDIRFRLKTNVFFYSF